MKKILIIVLCVLVAAGAGFGAWFVFFRDTRLVVDFYGDKEIVELLSGKGKYEPGKTISITAENKEGYDFEAWVKDGLIVSKEQTYIFTMSKQTSGKYTALYKAREYTIATSNQDLFSAQQIAKTDQVVIVSLTLPTGYEIDEMFYVLQNTEAKIDITNNQFVMPPQNIEIHVTIKVKQYSITYDLQGGAFEEDAITTYTINTPTFVLPTPVKEGYEFLGYTTEEETTPNPSYTITQGSTQDISVVAQWKLLPYTISKDVSGQGAISIADSSFAGEEVSLNCLPDTGYSLSRLYYIIEGTDEVVVINNNTFVMPQGNITIYVEFVKVMFTITYGETVDGSFSLSSDNAYVGDTITVTTTPDPGFELLHMYYLYSDGTNPNITFTDSFTMPAQDITVYAVFTATIYSIFYEADGGLLPEGTIKTFRCWDDIITLPIPTKDNHIFKGWYDNFRFVGEPITHLNPQNVGNKIYYAYFEIVKYNIRFVNYNGALLYEEAFAFGTMPDYGGIEPQKPEDENYTYTFVRWAPTLTIATEDATYTAVFTQTQKQYTINQNFGYALAGCDFTCPSTAAPGEIVEVVASPAEDFVIKKMYYILEGQTQQVEFDTTFTMPTSNITVTVVFEYQVSTLTALTNNASFGTASVTTIENRQVLSATPATNSVFVGWAKNSASGDIISRDAIFDPADYSEKIFCALFVKKSDVITDIYPDPYDGNYHFTLYKGIFKAVLTGYDGGNNYLTIPDYVGSGSTYTVFSIDTIMFDHTVKEVVIPATITCLESAPFVNGENSSIGDNPKKIISNSSYFTTNSSNTALFNKNKTILYAAKSDYNNIESGIKEIAPYAYHYNSSLTTITLPNTINKIGEYAFYQTNITIADLSQTKITRLEDHSFDNSSLTDIIFPDCLEYLGDRCMSFNMFPAELGGFVPTITLSLSLNSAHPDALSAIPHDPEVCLRTKEQYINCNNYTDPTGLYNLVYRAVAVYLPKDIYYEVGELDWIEYNYMYVIEQEGDYVLLIYANQYEMTTNLITNGTVIITDKFGDTYTSGYGIFHNTTLTITAIPNEGYRLAGITYNLEDSGELVVVDIDNPTFKMPDDEISIWIIFEKIDDTTGNEPEQPSEPDQPTDEPEQPAIGVPYLIQKAPLYDTSRTLNCINFAEAGTTVTISLEQDGVSWCSVDAVYYVGETSGTRVFLDTLSNTSSWQFVMPEENITIYVRFYEDPNADVCGGYTIDIDSFAAEYISCYTYAYEGDVVMLTIDPAIVDDYIIFYSSENGSDVISINVNNPKIVMPNKNIRIFLANKKGYESQSKK